MPDSHTAVLAPATIVSAVGSRDASGPRPLASVTPARRTRRVTFASGVVTLAASILVALAVPLMVVALPVVLLARLLLTIVWPVRRQTTGVRFPLTTRRSNPATAVTVLEG